MDIHTFIKFYDCILSDICGVLHNYTSKIGHASEIILQSGKPAVLLSNTIMSQTHVRSFLAKTYDIKGFDKIITSGDFAQYAQKEGLFPPLKGMLCFMIPAQDEHNILEIFDCKATSDITKADCVLAAAAPIPQDRTCNCYTLLHQALERNLPLFCFNNDIFINNGNQKLLRPGLIAEYYRTWGGSVYTCGKPDKAFYQYAFDNNTIPENTLCIGDSPTTDALGAHAIERDFLLTASGNPALFWDHSLPFSDNITLLSKRFNVPIPYATWSLTHSEAVTKYQ